MNISLTPELEKFISHELESGLYQSASEVIRAGLRLLKDEKDRMPRFVVSSAEELEQKLAEGLHELDRREGLPAKRVFAELKKRRRRTHA